MAPSQPTEEARPDPESFLAEANAEGAPTRGKLKIFLGAAPGVGKTYAMLEEARARAAAGTDVLVGIAETHGRTETAAILSHLEQVPRGIIAYRGKQLSEMDLDAILARKPQLVLIDELAHSNIPSARHPKRWQDVEEVLAAGIDVYSTLNIQHIESLNDVVARITGIRVQETVPDAVLQDADDIKVIDLSAEDLIQRMREGKVYMPAQAGRALMNFFTKPNLTALRELALRTAASRIDAEMLEMARSAGRRATAQDRLMVCLVDSSSAKSLVRMGRRMSLQRLKKETMNPRNSINFLTCSTPPMAPLNALHRRSKLPPAMSPRVSFCLLSGLPQRMVPPRPSWQATSAVR